MLQRGLLLVAITFSVVALILVGQFIGATIRPIPGLIYLFAACDPPAILGGWLAALGAMRAAGGSPGGTSRWQLLLAAVALTIVGVVVLGDFGLSRLMKGSAIAETLGSKSAWALADVATVVALGSLALACARTVRAAGARWPDTMSLVVAALLLFRIHAAIVGMSGPVPPYLRLTEAMLYGTIAWACGRASACVRGR